MLSSDSLSRDVVLSLSDEKASLSLSLHASVFAWDGDSFEWQKTIRIPQVSKTQQATRAKDRLKKVATAAYIITAHTTLTLSRSLKGTHFGRASALLMVVLWTAISLSVESTLARKATSAMMHNVARGPQMRRHGQHCSKRKYRPAIA